jgi:hypothetical protein
VVEPLSELLDLFLIRRQAQSIFALGANEILDSIELSRGGRSM